MLVGGHAACGKKIILRKYTDVSLELPNGNGNGRKLEIARWEKWRRDLSFWREWDGNGNEVIEMGGIWYEKSIPAHL